MGSHWERVRLKAIRGEPDEDVVAAAALRAERIQYLKAHPERRRLALEFLQGLALVARQQVRDLLLLLCIQSFNSLCRLFLVEFSAS